MEALKILLIYFAAINLAAFIIFGIDKGRAKRNRWRISEGTLFSLAIFGGSAGALLGMFCFHHKTQKKRFAIGIPLILFLQAALIAFILIAQPFSLSFM
ncbi:MAG: DUF1294 domain-containing protein [Lachnospiraceae bacterium]|nr:DUF1294 domain-containing protein [Lachnospiraceae bacterium]